MNTPPHKCSGCRKLVVGDCPDCTSQRRERADRTRFARVDRSLYRTERWKQYSKRFLALHPWCVGYPPGVHASHRVLAQVTDHVKPAAQFPNLFFDPDNHMALCKVCNDRKGNAAAEPKLQRSFRDPGGI